MTYNRFLPSQWLTSLQAVQTKPEAQNPYMGLHPVFNHCPHSCQNNTSVSQNFHHVPNNRSNSRSTVEYSFKSKLAECSERRTKNHSREQPKTSPPSHDQFSHLPRQGNSSFDIAGSSNNYGSFHYGYLPASYGNHIHPYKRGERHTRSWQRPRGYHSNSPDYGKHETPTPRGCRDVATSSANVVPRKPDEQFRFSRTWEDVGAAPRFSKLEKKIRIVSYNILSQKLLDINKGLYKKCNQNVLSWDFRWKNLSRELMDMDADILCLQEVEKYHYHKMISQCLADNGYEFIYKKRTSENPNKPDGVLVAFKRKHFKLVACKKVEYYRGEQRLLNQHNVGIVALLKIDLKSDSSRRIDSGCICVVNTHLLYSPKRGDVKLVQLSTLFSEVHRLINEHTDGNVPILLCGDFNSIPTSLIYKFITESEICYKDTDSKLISGQKVSKNAQVCLLQDPFLPKCLNISDECVAKEEDTNESNVMHEDLSAAAITRKPYYLRHSLGSLASIHDHQNPEASTTQDHGITVDYIFYSPQTQQKPSQTLKKANTTSLHLLRRFTLVSPDDLHGVLGIPNAVHSSDHLPIAAEFMVVKS